MKILEGLIQGTQDWLNFRQNHVGATDASVIMEMNAFQTRLELWQQKTLGWESILSDKEIARMAEGTRLEPIARQAFIERTGIVLHPQVGVHSEYEFLSASFDGLSEDNQVILEIKCGKKAYQMAECELIPDYYLCQMAHQMMIANAYSVFYFAFNGSNGILMEIMRDQAFIDKMLDQEIIFWNHVQAFTQPGSIYDTIRAIS